MGSWLTPRACLGLRTLWRRPSWVRIPPPAPLRNTSRVHEQSPQALNENWLLGSSGFYEVHREPYACYNPCHHSLLRTRPTFPIRGLWTEHRFGVSRRSPIRRLSSYTSSHLCPERDSTDSSSEHPALRSVERV